MKHIVWEIAFDIYETEESLAEGKPDISSCWVGEQHLPEELSKAIEEAIFNAVEEGKYDH